MRSPMQYQRKTFPVQAIQITPENIFEIAAWCGGVVYKSDRLRISLKEVTPRPKMATAYVGHWILKTSQTFAVYSDKSFQHSFEPV